MVHLHLFVLPSLAVCIDGVPLEASCIGDSDESDAQSLLQGVSSVRVAKHKASEQEMERGESSMKMMKQKIHHKMPQGQSHYPGHYEYTLHEYSQPDCAGPATQEAGNLEFLVLATNELAIDGEILHCQGSCCNIGGPDAEQAAAMGLHRSLMMNSCRPAPFPDADCRGEESWDRPDISDVLGCQSSPSGSYRVTCQHRAGRAPMHRLNHEFACSQHRETTGTCNWFGCWSWRGETECVDDGSGHHRCLCAEGQCSDHTAGGHGVCVNPQVWAELHSAPPFSGRWQGGGLYGDSVIHIGAECFSEFTSQQFRWMTTYHCEHIAGGEWDFVEQRGNSEFRHHMVLNGDSLHFHRDDHEWILHRVEE